MKNTLLAGLFLLFITVIVLILLTGGYALYMASGFSTSGIETDGGTFFRTLLHSLPLQMPLALAVGFYLTFLRLRHRPGIRPLTSLLLFLTASGLLLLTSLFLGLPESAGEAAQSGNGPEYLTESFTRLNSGALIYRDTSDSGEFRGVLIDFDNETEESLEILMSAPPASEVRKTPLKLEAFPEREGFESLLFNDFTMVGEDLAGWRQSGQFVTFLLSVAAFALYLTSCWGLIHISRWPLFNALTTLILLAGGGVFYRVFSADIFQEFLTLLEGWTFGIPPVVLTMFTAALLLLLLDLLFIPYLRRMEEG